MPAAGWVASSARRSRAHGYQVAVNYRRSREDAEATAEAVQACGSHAHLVQADVSDDTAVRSMIDEVVGTFGGLDALVNNAGDKGHRVVGPRRD